MRNLVAAALVLLTASAAFANEADDPNPDWDLPPLSCRLLFPPRPWCVEQAKAAEAFRDKCERALATDLDPKERRRWRKLLIEARLLSSEWSLAAEVQAEETKVAAAYDRRRGLHILYHRLGPDAFHAGRMPPPVPAGAPID